MAVCESLGISTQNEADNYKLFLPQSADPFTLFDDTTTNNNNNNKQTPLTIQWDSLPLSCIGKPDLSRIRTSSTCSTVSSAYSDIQLYGPSSLAYDDIDTDDMDSNKPIFIQSLALSRVPSIDDITSIAGPTDIDPNNTQDSYDSPSDYETDERDDTPIPTPNATQSSPPHSTTLTSQKTHKICGQHSESTCDYNDEILPEQTPTLINHSVSSFDIGPPLPFTMNEYHQYDLQYDLGQNSQMTPKQMNTTKINVAKIQMQDKEGIPPDNIEPQTQETSIGNHIQCITQLRKYTQTQLKSYEEICENVLLKYNWQKPICNEQNYGAFYPNFQREIMNNPFFNLTAGDFNDVLKKCQFIRSRWIGEKIKSTRKGMLGKASWNIGEKITELDLFAIKLYTDFEICQRELKKCYRLPINDNSEEMYQYEQRLCYFSHWRRLLNIAIRKYGILLKNRIFYHGINKIMELDIHPTHRCHGPFSATSDLEIARGFATKNGLILKMTSKFPRLGTDYYFDAAPISAYPDEKEYLIGFMYTRILNVSLGCTKLSIADLDENTIQKLTCFVIQSLIKNNLYSYGPYLELLFHALLISDASYHTISDTLNNYFTDKELADIEAISKMIPQTIIDEFIRIRMDKKVLKLDVMSEKMKPLFYKENKLCIRKIYEYASNISELHLYENEYTINDEFICDFLYFIKLYPKLNLNAIKLFKYSFEGSVQQFQFKQYISKTNEMKLQSHGWYMYELHNQNYYKFILKKTEKKEK